MKTQTENLSYSLVKAVMARHTAPKAQWHYEHGLILKALEAVWRVQKDPQIFTFIQSYLDNFVQDDGSIKSYTLSEYNVDQVNPGKNLLFLYRATRAEKYRIAVDTLRSQLDTHPRTASGGLWHKKIYPNQMWLDGLYMYGPFYAEFSSEYNKTDDFDDLVKQFELLETNARDAKTGLLYHAWDESRQQLWANPETGCSPHFWSRALGWYAMALVDTLDFLPADHRGQSILKGMLERLAKALGPVADEETGLWYQVLDQGKRSGNYLESSGSSMFIYALLKGLRKGYLTNASYKTLALRALEGLKKHRLSVDAQGLPSLGGICSVAGLGGNPYRDGSFAYYVSEKIVNDDYKGLGPFILALVEAEHLSEVSAHA